MSRRFAGSLCLLAFVCVSARSGVAQTPAPQARFAVEILGESLYPVYATIPAATSQNSCSTFNYQGSLRRVTNANTGIEQPSGLEIEVCVQGDTFLITPIVFYGKVNHPLWFTSLQKLRRQALAARTGKLNESVVFSEMEEGGLEPVTIRIVTNEPRAPYRPVTRSEVSSVLIDYTPVDRQEGMITLRNLSGKAVDAFRIGRFQEEGSREESSIGSYKSDGFSSVIAPGAVHHMRIGVPHSGKMVNGVFVEARKPEYMVLQAVLFADGSYEGDEQMAAEMAAEVFGARVQFARIKRLVEPILAEKGLDDVAKIERIRAAIQQLPTQPGPEMIAQFHAQYANFPAAMLTHAERGVGSAMKAENWSMSSAFQENEPMIRQHPHSSLLAQSWAMMIRRNPE